MHACRAKSSAGNHEAQDWSGAWRPEESNRSADYDVAGDPSTFVAAAIEAGAYPSQRASGEFSEARYDKTDRDQEKKKYRCKAPNLTCVHDPTRAEGGD